MGKTSAAIHFFLLPTTELLYCWKILTRKGVNTWHFLHQYQRGVNILLPSECHKTVLFCDSEDITPVPARLVFYSNWTLKDGGILISSVP